MKKCRDELNNCKVDLQEALDKVEASTSPSSSSAQASSMRDLEKVNKALKEELEVATKGGDGGGAEIETLKAQIAEKDEALEVKVKENEELQKVCNELFVLVEAKENS